MITGNTLLEVGRLVDERIARAVSRLARNVRGTLVTSSSPTGRLVAAALFRALEVEPRVEVAQHYGFASQPPPGVEVIAVPIGGSSGHRVVVAEIDPALRPIDLLSGESCLYGPALNRVQVLTDGSVEVKTAAGTSVKVTAAGQVQLAGGGAGVARIGDTVTITGTDSASGPITAVGTISSGSALVTAGG